MSLEVFEVEEDWSSACISVRKRCVFDIISIAYARFFIRLRLGWKCPRVSWTSFGSRLGTVLSTFRYRLNPFWALLEGFEVFWTVLEASWHRLGACLRRFWSILSRLVGPLEVSSRRFSEPRGCLGGDIAFGVGFLMLCECLGDRFSVFFLLKTMPIQMKIWLHT